MTDTRINRVQLGMLLLFAGAAFLQSATAIHTTNMLYAATVGGSGIFCAFACEIAAVYHLVGGLRAHWRDWREFNNG